jgi:parallel beta-helix repeat protein
VLIDSNDVNLAGFKIKNSLYGYFGIYLSAANCNIYNNEIRGQRTHGISLLGADDNTIKDNIIKDNDYGIYLVESYNNLIYNNIFDNTNNAFDNGMNTWNIAPVKQENIIGWPWTAGNYWSDYMGQDTDIMKDALGDTMTPHNCNGDISNGGDNEPLMYTLCIDAMKIYPFEPGIYYKDNFYPLGFLKEPVFIGPTRIIVQPKEFLYKIIDKIIITINGKKVWEMDGPIFEPPIYQWNQRMFKRCEVVIEVIDKMDNSVKFKMNPLKLF